jgi:hypothetical protein
MCIAGTPPAHKNATAWLASNHPFEAGAPVSRFAHTNKMAAARMLRPLIVIPSIVIPSWSAALLPRQHVTTTRQDKPGASAPIQSERNGL